MAKSVDYDESQLREQVKKAALLIDVYDPKDLSKNLYNLINDEKIKLNLIENGYEQIKFFENYDRLSLLNNIIIKFRGKLNNF